MNNSLMIIYSLMPERILLTSHLGPESKKKAVLPGIWVGSWLVIPQDRNEY